MLISVIDCRRRLATEKQVNEWKVGGIRRKRSEEMGDTLKREAVNNKRGVSRSVVRVRPGGQRRKAQLGYF